MRTRFWLGAALMILLLIFAGPGRSEEKISAPGRYSGYSKPLYQGMKCASQYVPMRDGVRLAVDACVPRGLKAGEKIPAILFQTRYWRSMVIPIMSDHTDKFLTSYGYAVVKVDVRGTGASFGTWPYPWSEAEVKDGAEVVDWIISQPWSDKSVGTFGNSYVGATSEFLLVNQHPAVKAAVIRYSLFDTYPDIAYPGGIHLAWFLDSWNQTDQALDRNDTGALLQMMGKAKSHLSGIPGVKPAGKGFAAIRDLKQAIKEHQQNGDVFVQSQLHQFRDETWEDYGLKIERISPYFYQDRLESSGAVIYSYTGWFDGAYTAPSIYRFLTLSNCKKLIIGPWPHSGKENISPWRSSRENTFDHQAELLRFFDYHLKGIQNGIMDEPRVYYYTMGAEEWNSAETWPVPAKTRTYYFSGGHTLSRQAPLDDSGSDVYQVDYTAGTGNASRYNSLVNLAAVPIGYPDRAKADQKLLVYETAALEKDLEVTGHPVVRLYVSSTATDGQFFVYLEDVSPGNTVSYLTEGMLRAACRKVSGNKPPYVIPGNIPYHTFENRDAEPLIPGEIYLITFGLQPTSVLFRKGHRLRVAIAGADKDHFALPQGPEPELTFYRSASNASAIDLPVVSEK